MKFRSVRHRGLMNLLQDQRPVGVPAAYLDKIQKMLSFLEVIGTIEELRAVPFWRVHQLSGDRKGVFSMTISRNWRMTFRLDDDQTTILDLDLEDYHRGHHGGKQRHHDEEPEPSGGLYSHRNFCSLGPFGH